MKESNILADNVAKNFLSREISLDTEEKFMKVYIIADNVAKDFLSREIAMNTKDLFMKESYILADNVAKIFLIRANSQDTEDPFMRESKTSLRKLWQRIFSAGRSRKTQKISP